MPVAGNSISCFIIGIYAQTGARDSGSKEVKQRWAGSFVVCPYSFFYFFILYAIITAYEIASKLILSRFPSTKELSTKGHTILSGWPDPSFHHQKMMQMAKGAI